MAGKFNAAGLPDAQGYVRPLVDCGEPEDPITNGSGAFEVQGYVGSGGGFVSNGTYKAARTLMSLAKYSTVYGASSTVMPSSVDIAVGLYLGSVA